MRPLVVASLNIATVSWGNNILEIQFYSGIIFECTHVTKSEFERFMRCPSLESALLQLKTIHPYHRVH